MSIRAGTYAKIQSQPRYTTAHQFAIRAIMFAQADTLIPSAGSSQAWDRYAYAMNNPLRYVDPSGHEAVCTEYDDDGECVQYEDDGSVVVDPVSPSELANRLFLSLFQSANSGNTAYFWLGLTDEQRYILSAGGWDEGGYNDAITMGGCSPADIAHDPATYIVSVVGAGGLAKVGYSALVNYATINAGSGVLSIGSNGLYQKPGYTYFQLPPNVYTGLQKIGISNAINVSVINNQIEQGKSVITSLANPSQPGPGTLMEMDMLRVAQYVESTGNFLGVDRLFQPPTWQWIP